MTQFLPPNLLVLFAPRDPLPYLPPTGKLAHEKKRLPYTGVSDYLDYFEDPEETPLPVPIETRQERRERRLREKLEQAAYKLEQDLAVWDPQNNIQATSNPYKTLFVGRINYDTSETKLRREFEQYGKIKNIKIVNDVNTGKPRGYAFIEYEDETSMHAAYKKADGKKIDGRRVVVDIERGRTIEGWKPRRLGGGKGGTRRLPVAQKVVYTDFDDVSTATSVHDRNVNSKDRDRGGGDRLDRGERDRDRGVRSDRDRGDRERERGKRSRDRKSHSRSREREKKRKSRSRSKDRHRSKSRERTKKSRRSRSREKENNKSIKKEKRSRSRERTNRQDVEIKVEANENGGGHDNY